MQRQRLDAALYIKPTVNGNAVEPFDGEGTETVLFCVFTQLIVWPAPFAKS